MRTHILQSIALLLLMMFSPVKASAQTTQFQSLYIMNFMKNTSWTTPDNQDLVVTILNDQPLYTDLTKIVQTKRIGLRNVKVVSVSRLQDITPSDVIIVGTSKAGRCNEIKKIHNKNTLIISCAAGQCYNGAAICFMNVDGKLSFEISERNILEQKLSVSGKLYNLGIKVN